jgi:hypothetical protein
MASQLAPSFDPDLAQLLLNWSGGDRSAFDRVATVVYDEVRRLAHDRHRGERPDHTLNSTGSVQHEAYVRLVDVERMEWNGTVARDLRFAMTWLAREWGDS